MTVIGPPSPPPRGARTNSVTAGAGKLRVSRLGAPAAPGLLAQLARIEEDFDVRAKKVAEATTRLHTTADNEAVHDLRVALRRLNAALRMWRDLLRPRAGRRSRRQLRDLRRALGPVRELEVDVARLAQLSREVPPESRVALEGLLLGLHQRLDRRRRRAARAADSHTMERLARSVARATDALRLRPGHLPEPQLVARVHIDQARERALAALTDGLQSNDDDRLHAGRVALKKWRYAIETASALFDPGVPLEPLRDLQKVLGDVHDLAMLRDRLERRAEKLRAANMTSHAAALDPAFASLHAERERGVERAHELATRLVETTPGEGSLALAPRPTQNP